MRITIDEATTFKTISELPIGKPGFKREASNEDLIAWQNVFAGQSVRVPRLKLIAMNVAMAFPVQQTERYI